MIIKKNGNQLTKTFTDNDSATPSIIAVDNESRRRSEASRIYNANFSGSVVQFDAVYWDSGNQYYEQSVADGSPAQKVIGIADINKSEIILFGIVEDFPGFVEGNVLYLSPTNPGELTTVVPTESPIKVGEIVYSVAKGKLILLVDIDNYINAVNADILDGRHAGTSSGQISVNTGVLNTDLNADKLEGFDATSSNNINTIPVRDANGIIYASRFDSDVATGTSPFVVDSTTVVPNLNVDMVDGHHLDQNVNTTSIPLFSHLMIDSTALVDNLNSELLNSQTGPYYLSRTNHTGTQSVSTIDNLQTSLDSYNYTKSYTMSKAYPIVQYTGITANTTVTDALVLGRMGASSGIDNPDSYKLALFLDYRTCRVYRQGLTVGAPDSWTSSLTVNNTAHNACFSHGWNGQYSNKVYAIIWNQSSFYILFRSTDNGVSFVSAGNINGSLGFGFHDPNNTNFCAHSGGSPNDRVVIVGTRYNDALPTIQYSNSSGDSGSFTELLLDNIAGYNPQICVTGNDTSIVFLCFYVGVGGNNLYVKELSFNIGGNPTLGPRTTVRSGAIYGYRIAAEQPNRVTLAIETSDGGSFYIYTSTGTATFGLISTVSNPEGWNLKAISHAMTSNSYQNKGILFMTTSSKELFYSTDLGITWKVMMIGSQAWYPTKIASCAYYNEGGTSYGFYRYGAYFRENADTVIFTHPVYGSGSSALNIKGCITELLRTIPIT